MVSAANIEVWHSWHLQLVSHLLVASALDSQHLMYLKPNQIIVHEEGRHVRPHGHSSLLNSA
jgi:hypothetical protein